VINGELGRRGVHISQAAPAEFARQQRATNPVTAIRTRRARWSDPVGYAKRATALPSMIPGRLRWLSLPAKALVALVGALAGGRFVIHFLAPR
jgi:hypothetical protein